MHIEEYCATCRKPASYFVLVDGKWVCSECKDGSSKTVRSDRSG
jgi:hypothetical protein